MEVPSPRVNAMSWAFLSFLNYVLLHHIASLSYRFTTYFFTVCPDRNMTALFILESKRVNSWPFYYLGMAQPSKAVL